MSNHITPEPKPSDPATRGHFCDNTGCVFFIELPVELAQPPVVPAALHDAEARRQLVQVGRLGRRLEAQAGGRARQGGAVVRLRRGGVLEGQLQLLEEEK